MIRELIDSVSFWWLIIFCMLFFLFLTYVSALASAYFFSKQVNKVHREMANTLIGILSGGFTILLAFVILNAWGYQMSARNATSREADYLAVIVRNADVFPPEIQEKIIKAAFNYGVAVRVDEWQKMRKGKESQKAWDAFEKLYASVQNYTPQTAYEKLYYNQLLNHINDLLKSRRERLTQLDSAIPTPIRTALIGGSILLALILGGIRGENNFFNLMPVLLFALVLGFNLGLAISFDYPYSGDIAVSNKLFYSGVLGRFSNNCLSFPATEGCSY